MTACTVRTPEESLTNSLIVTGSGSFDWFFKYRSTRKEPHLSHLMLSIRLLLIYKVTDYGEGWSLGRVAYFIVRNDNQCVATIYPIFSFKRFQYPFSLFYHGFGLHLGDEGERP